MQTPEPVAPENRLALRNFCECAYQPSDARARAVLDHDWSHFPRIERALESLPTPVTRESLCDLATRLLREAITDLDPCFPLRPDAVSPLEIFRMHVIERVPWPSIEALLSEQGRPHARGTLIRRQHEFLPYVAQWARDGRELAAETPALAEGTDPPAQGTARRARWRPMAAGCALLLAILVGYLWGQRGETVESEPVDLVAELDSAQKGQMFRWPRGAKHLPAPHSALRLPAPPHHYSQGMFLEYQPGRIGLLLPEPRESGGPARMTLWDPLEEVVIWEFSFSPPCEERITHKTVGPEVCEAAYFVSLVFHAGTTFDLGEYLVAVLMQDYSPTFVTFVAVQTGELHGYYVHPGQLNRGVVLDLDADGRPELILGGTDNAVNRPALLALHPGPGRRAASTVLWNESGEEGARCRVLFAASPDLAAAAGTARLHVSEVFERSFDLSFRVLTVGVGEPTARSGPTFYHARLGPDLRPLPLAPLVLWDADELALQALGFTDPPLDEWSADILVFEGTP